MLTLWDLLEPLIPRQRRKPRPTRSALAPATAPPSAPPASSPPSSMLERYESLARDLLAAHSIRVRKWRSSMSGLAWIVHYRDGSVARLIEAPRPRGPMSAAVFLHEIGHHVIGFNRFKPRCLEEFHAWAWSLDQMQQRHLNITDAVRHRMHASLHYAIAKARRRGLKSIPSELQAFADRPPPRRRRC